VGSSAEEKAPPGAAGRLTSPLAPAAAHRNHTRPTTHHTCTSFPKHALIQRHTRQLASERRADSPAVR